MIRTKSLISDLQEIPKTWVFEYYLNLDDKLCGQDVKIKSVFNPNEKNPSMYIYYSHAKNITDIKISQLITAETLLILYKNYSILVQEERQLIKL